nr:PREDICTED: small integral membrane protein 15 [Bos mutus]
MFHLKAWAEYVVEWAAKDPYGFLTTVILAGTPLFLASAVRSWKLASMSINQKKKQKRQENIAKAKRLKKGLNECTGSVSRGKLFGKLCIFERTHQGLFLDLMMVLLNEV